MTSFPNKAGVAIIFALIDEIHRNKQSLSDIDGLIGDGDHGINMNKGFQMCKQRLVADTDDMSGAFRVLAQVLMDHIGGAMGPLYGSFFKAMAKASMKADPIDAGLFADMLTAAEQKVRDIGQCQLGDKTLLDVLAPASDAFKKNLANGGSFADALDAMSAAAEIGREATIDMIAKKGRASRLKERSKGVPDPGATSCCLILNTMARTVKQLLADA
ncbi:MAG: dihydroxyacetone kinase subunit L [Planctomycetes bacterium]|nr:dihydroxyacetone kinase subunit L [Planctomycetota bacterium]